MHVCEEFCMIWGGPHASRSPQATNAGIIKSENKLTKQAIKIQGTWNKTLEETRGEKIARQKPEWKQQNCQIHELFLWKKKKKNTKLKIGNC